MGLFYGSSAHYGDVSASGFGGGRMRVRMVVDESGQTGGLHVQQTGAININGDLTPQRYSW